MLACTSSGLAATLACPSVGPWRQRAAHGHLQRVGRHLEQKRDPGQSGQRAEDGRAGRTGDEHQVGEAPEVHGEGHSGHRRAAVLTPASLRLTLACHGLVSLAWRSLNNLRAC